MVCPATAVAHSYCIFWTVFINSPLHWVIQCPWTPFMVPLLQFQTVSVQLATPFNYEVKKGIVLRFKNLYIWLLLFVELDDSFSLAQHYVSVLRAGLEKGCICTPGLYESKSWRLRAIRQKWLKALMCCVPSPEALAEQWWSGCVRVSLKEHFVQFLLKCISDNPPKASSTVMSISHVTLWLMLPE